MKAGESLSENRLRPFVRWWRRNIAEEKGIRKKIVDSQVNYADLRGTADHPIPDPKSPGFIQMPY